ncbi:MAG: hypothetical protein SNF33_04990 [Candidatus Algichlamydia australiensis]|nr:hypothetical protein [Chlamydiales bacterium]
MSVNYQNPFIRGYQDPIVKGLAYSAAGFNGVVGLAGLAFQLRDGNREQAVRGIEGPITRNIGEKTGKFVGRCARRVEIFSIPFILNLGLAISSPFLSARTNLLLNGSVALVNLIGLYMLDSALGSMCCGGSDGPY